MSKKLYLCEACPEFEEPCEYTVSESDVLPDRCPYENGAYTAKWHPPAEES